MRVINKKKIRGKVGTPMPKYQCMDCGKYCNTVYDWMCEDCRDFFAEIGEHFSHNDLIGFNE